MYGTQLAPGHVAKQMLIQFSDTNGRVSQPCLSRAVFALTTQYPLKVLLFDNQAQLPLS